MNKNEEENKEEEQKWLDWAIELQSLAQAGLAYGKDKFDIERFERIREIRRVMENGHCQVDGRMFIFL